MTSEERHEARYQRRKARRTARARAACGKSYDEVINFGTLADAGNKCCNGSMWKTSTINFKAHRLSECRRLLKDLDEGTRRFNGFHSFVTVEHGKVRHIDALPIRERTLQKAICQNLLTEAFSRSFTADNSASIQGRGMDYALRRLAQQLAHHFRVYGLEGGIYQFDFKGYFGSLPHDAIKERARRVIWDPRLYKLFCTLVDEFQLMQTADRTAARHRGVGLGSEVSQIIALDFASPIDHYIKDRRRIKGAARYMDDGYVISNSLAELRDIDRCVHRMAEDMGLTLNRKKCTITPFRHHSFAFLKMRFRIEASGKITVRPSRKSIRAMRRKLQVFRTWLDAGKMGFEDIAQSYQSWRAHIRRCNSSHRTLEAMDARFVALFTAELRARKKKYPCTLRAKRTKAGWEYTRNMTAAEKAAA